MSGGKNYDFASKTDGFLCEEVGKCPFVMIFNIMGHLGVDQITITLDCLTYVLEYGCDNLSRF